MSSSGRSVLQQRGREGDPPSSASACCYVPLGSGKSLTKQDRPWHKSSLCWVLGASNNSHLRGDVSVQQVPNVFPSEGSEASLPLAATGFLSHGCRHALLSFCRFSSLRSSATGAGVSPQQMLRSQRVAEATLTGGPEEPSVREEVPSPGRTQPSPASPTARGADRSFGGADEAPLAVFAARNPLITSSDALFLTTAHPCPGTRGCTFPEPIPIPSSYSSSPWLRPNASRRFRSFLCGQRHPPETADRRTRPGCQRRGAAHCLCPLDTSRRSVTRALQKQVCQRLGHPLVFAPVPNPS